MINDEITKTKTVATMATHQDKPNKAPINQPQYYAVGSILFLGLLYVFSEYAVRWSSIGIALCAWIVSIPILINGIYRTSIRRTLFLRGLSQDGYIYKYFSGYIVRLMAYTFLSLCAAIVLITEVIYTPRPHVQLWSSLVGAALVLYLVHLIVHPLVAREALDWHTGRISTTLSSFLVSILTTVTFSIWSNWAADIPIYTSIGAAVASQPQFIVNEPSLGLLLDYYNQARGSAEYVFGLLRASVIGSITYIFFYELMVFFFFFGVTSALSTFCLPLWELKRAVVPTTEPSPGVSLGTSVSAATVVIVVSVVCFYGFWNLTREIESIHGQYVRRGTAEQIKQTRVRYETLLRQQLSDVSLVEWTAIESSIDDVTIAMKSNVDSFLSWYYGVGGEIFRTTRRVAGWFTRNGDQYERQLVEKLYAFLLEDVEDDPYSKDIAAYHRLVDTLIQVTTEQYNAELKQIISSNAIEPSITGPVTVVVYDETVTFDVADELRESLRMQREAFLQRQRASVITGAVGGAVAATVVGKSVFRRGIGNANRLVQRLPQATRPLAKTVLIGSRIVSASSGAALLAMVVLTVGTEYALLKYHERKDRPQFRDLLFDAIDVSQRDIKTELQRLLEYRP